MRLHVTAFALAAGLMWGSVVLLANVANVIWPPYGGAFLQLVASIYPGYHPEAGGGAMLIGAIWGLFDGLIGGAVFAWLYNLLARNFSKAV